MTLHKLFNNLEFTILLQTGNLVKKVGFEVACIRLIACLFHQFIRNVKYFDFIIKITKSFNYFAFHVFVLQQISSVMTPLQSISLLQTYSVLLRLQQIEKQLYCFSDLLWESIFEHRAVEHLELLQGIF